MVSEHAEVRVIGPDHPWVSRGGVKLAHALDTFGLDVTGRLGLDIGASTGGFTDVLLTRGARAGDRRGRRPRPAALEAAHRPARRRRRGRERAPPHRRRPARPRGPPGIVTIDVSFISLALILPVLLPLLAPATDVVALVKPQFEAGRREAPKGIVRDPPCTRGSSPR